MRRGKFDPERWKQAKELAEQGCWVSEGARILKIHHTSALYISRQMGFTWAACPARFSRFKPPTAYFPRKKPVSGLLVSDEPVEYVERLMRLAGA